MIEKRNCGNFVTTIEADLPFFYQNKQNRNPVSLQMQSYFAACEDETPAIRNHDRVLQRLCEHLDHALLYG